MGLGRNQKENQKYLETNENGNITYQKLWHAAKVVLRSKFIAIKINLKKKKRPKINT